MVSHFGVREKYCLHYRNLQFYLQKGSFSLSFFHILDHVHNLKQNLFVLQAWSLKKFTDVWDSNRLHSLLPTLISWHKNERKQRQKYKYRFSKVYPTITTEDRSKKFAICWIVTLSRQNGILHFWFRYLIFIRWKSLTRVSLLSTCDKFLAKWTSRTS